VEDFRDAEKAAIAQKQPFTLGLHPHWFMKVQRLAQARKRLGDHRADHPDPADPKYNRLRFLPDTAHLTIADDDPMLAVNQFFDRLAAVHLKDWTPAYGRYSHRYSQGFVSLGHGDVKLPEVLQALAEKKYDGWVVVEQDSADPTAAESAFQCAEWLHERGSMVQPDRPKLDEVIARERSAPALPRSDSELVREAKLLERLIPATVRGPEGFYQTVVESLHDIYGLDAAKLYSYFPANDELYLLAVHGMEGSRRKGAATFRKRLKWSGNGSVIGIGSMRRAGWFRAISRDGATFRMSIRLRSREKSLRVRAVGPWLDAANKFERHVTNSIQRGGRIAYQHRDANQVSSAVLIEYGEAQIVLGGDMEDINWHALTAQSERPSFQPSLVKVSHHASTNGRIDGMWPRTGGFFDG